MVRDRERCVFCDIVRQEVRQGKRMVDVPAIIMRCARTLRACRMRCGCCLAPTIISLNSPGPARTKTSGCVDRTHAAPSGKDRARLHLVMHTAPNTRNKKGELSDYWHTIADDYHWHIEILPIVEQRSKSYSIKEVYFNAVLPEQAAEQLRSIDPNS